MLRHPLRTALGPAFILMVVAGLSGPATAQTGGDTEVTVGSNDGIFSQNKQNEPAVAIDSAHPTVVAAGANDNIDMEACNAGPPTDCPFTLDVGGSGVYFSFDSGDSWIQPTYTGLTARDCLGDPDPTVTTDVCVAHPGRIGTLPHYDEAGLVSDGDPALAFGPIPDDNGEFDWDNGSRLYYANLTSNLSVSETITFKGFEAIGVSRIDGDPALTPAIVADEDNWLDPVIVSKQSSATFSDKEQVWADNAESSPFFGNVYVCFAKFQGSGGQSMFASTSRDGGDTWSSKQVAGGSAVAPLKWGTSGCTIRTDSEGTIYLFYEQFQSPFFVENPVGTQFLVRSFNGGASWTRPVAIDTERDPCPLLQFDGSTQRCVMDGIAGARADLTGSPNVTIANGAPTGKDATDEIVRNWIDATTTNHEDVMVSTSADGLTWSDPVAVQASGDRGYYTAPALSPDGTDLYLVYNAFTTPLRNDTTSPRGLVGVVLHAEVGSDGSLSGWSEIHRGVVGDPRGSAQNNIVMEFLGDYVYAAATNDYGVAVWNDTRDAGVCPAVNAWRAAMQADPSMYPEGRPAIQQVCPATFGNSDIYGSSITDPTP